MTSPVLAQTEKNAKVLNHNTDKQAEENATIIRTRLNELENLIKSVQWEPHKSPGLDAPEQEKKAEHEWQKWFFSVRSDLQEYARACKAFLKLNGEDMMSKMAAMNMQFSALQEATQMESRKFQTLSNASKARHDIAMNAIRNMK
jgi:hypothetical protein